MPHTDKEHDGCELDFVPEALDDDAVERMLAELEERYQEARADG